MRAGVTVDESHFWPHRLPVEIALLMASVSSVDPSPRINVSHGIYMGRVKVRIPFAPKSLTLRKIWKAESLKATVPCLLMSEIQYDDGAVGDCVWFNGTAPTGEVDGAVKRRKKRSPANKATDEKVIMMIKYRLLMCGVRESGYFELRNC